MPAQCALADRMLHRQAFARNVNMATRGVAGGAGGIITPQGQNTKQIFPPCGLTSCALGIESTIKYTISTGQNSEI